jgi:hypothetical protein
MDTFLFIYFVYALVCASFCHTIIKAKKYPVPFQWAIGGFLFGIITVIAAAGMPMYNYEPPKATLLSD